jgi:hypothetical protein
MVTVYQNPVQEVEVITSSILNMARELIKNIDHALLLVDANELETLIAALTDGHATGTHEGAYTKEQLSAVIYMYRALKEWVTEPFGGTSVAPITMLYKRWPAPITSE